MLFTINDLENASQAAPLGYRIMLEIVCSGVEKCKSFDFEESIIQNSEVKECSETQCNAMQCYVCLARP